MFKKILIVNRGEIAVRIIRACRELGIISAAVYSDADSKSLHTRLADESYHIGSSETSLSYLNKDKLLKLAADINADAIHPGYGFFSENFDFISSVEKSGITFIGPSSRSVKLMGNKTSARKLMADHNVPIVPGTTSPVNSISEGKKAAEKIGYPILLKASSGGGGKGMRKVESVKEFDSALEATKREAKKSFAEDSVYIEKYIDNPKHIEVQILADKKGNYVHLFERECSIQRRHQKIIEEAPSGFLDKKTRTKITTAAINAAKACKYYNAGTIEFLMDADKNFYFLEMNTRLQVEHPVTELITGIDIVKEQISVAAGNTLSFKQSDVKINGHAIEFRVYAEDAANNFMPSTGKLIHYAEPSGPGIRVDSGFTQGSDISLYYDPLISKLIAWSDDRNSAIKRLLRALGEYRISGIITNIDFAEAILSSTEFRSGKFNINFLSDDNIRKLKKKNQNGINKDLLNIAAIFSAVHKSEFIPKTISGNSHSKNDWVEQIYD